MCTGENLNDRSRLDSSPWPKTKELHTLIIYVGASVNWKGAEDRGNNAKENNGDAVQAVRSVAEGSRGHRTLDYTSRVPE